MTSSQTQDFDVIVIGSGPGGYVCAIRCAQLGYKTACIEAEKTLGGTCLNVGCIPSKALLESSHHYHRLKHEISEHGITTGETSFDLKKMLARKDRVVKTITKGVDYLFAKNKVSWLKGHGRFIDANHVAVVNQGQEAHYHTKFAVIATGSSPIELPIAPFDHQLIVNSSDALTFSSVPKHLVVVGGGVIGLELGSVWARLGSQVTVVEACDQILVGSDREVSSHMHKILTKQGLQIELNTRLEGLEKIENDKVEVFCQKKGEKTSFIGDKALIAVGRKPNTNGLGLQQIGVQCDAQGRIEVNSSWQTSQPNIYALGDVIPGLMLAHKASEEGIAVAETLAGEMSHINYSAIPNIVYTWPEMASIGLSEEQCCQQGLEYKVGKFFFKANGRARAMAESEGFAKAIADKKTDKLLGFHILGACASEMIAEIAIAFEYGASSEDIARSVHAHPTLAEIMKEAALDVDGRAIHC